MKKIVGLLLIAVMMLSFSGCMNILTAVSELGDAILETTEEAGDLETGYTTLQECLESALAVDHKFTVLSREQIYKMYCAEYWDLMIRNSGMTSFDAFYDRYRETAAEYAEAFRDADIYYKVLEQTTVTLETMSEESGVSFATEEELRTLEKVVGTRTPELLRVAYRFSANEPDSDKEIYVEIDVFYFYQRDGRWYVFKL